MKLQNLEKDFYIYLEENNMKNIFKNFKKMNYYFLVLFLLLNPNFSFAEIKFGNDKSRAVSEYVIIEVFDSHGIETERHKDITGDPHLVFKTKTVADNIAIFFDGCGTVGCEEVTLYADFGIRSKATLELLNDWNHIGNRFRTTAFKSGSATDPNGNVGISMHLSMHSNSDIENLKFLTALFLIEVEMFYSQIK